MGHPLGGHPAVTHIGETRLETQSGGNTMGDHPSAIPLWGRQLGDSLG
jgi:hypothetical protein